MDVMDVNSELEETAVFDPSLHAIDEDGTVVSKADLKYNRAPNGTILGVEYYLNAKYAKDTKSHKAARDRVNRIVKLAINTVKVRADNAKRHTERPTRYGKLLSIENFDRSPNSWLTSPSTTYTDDEDLEIVETSKELLDAKAVDDQLEAILEANKKVIDGNYGKQCDRLMKRCALLTVIANDTGIRSALHKRCWATGLLSLKRSHFPLNDATRNSPPTYGLKFNGKYGVPYERQNIPINERFYAFFKAQYEAASGEDIVIKVSRDVFIAYLHCLHTRATPCVFRKIHASGLFKRTLDLEAARANGNRAALEQAFLTAEATTRAYPKHTKADSLYYCIYKWIVTSFCLEHNFKVRELVRDKAALAPWLRKAVADQQQSTSVQMLPSASTDVPSSEEIAQMPQNGDDKDLVIERQADEISRLTAALEQTTAEKKLVEDECHRLQSLLDAKNEPNRKPRKRRLNDTSEQSTKSAHR